MADNRPLRIQFAASDEDVQTLDNLGDYFGGIDRQSVLRIALKRLTEDVAAKRPGENYGEKSI